MDYNPRSIERKWRSFWEEKEVYKVTNNETLPKYYVLDMFPYPSGSGLHVGHPLGYIASDIFARYKRHKGFNVLHPMGYDAFGLPAEQYAITTGVHPAVSTAENIKRYREQLDNIGFSFDWSREVQTCDPSYYKWTQWIFIQLFEHYYDNDADKAMPIEDLIAKFETEGNANVNATNSMDSTFSSVEWKAMSPKEKDDVLMNYRLAYRKISYVNWCEELGTILANDEVKDGVSERGGYPVEVRPMLQWSLRITAYAQRLLEGLDVVDWSESLKTQQRNWIGRSEGASVFFEIEKDKGQIEVFTTRPDTIFGATFMVLAPEHDLVEQITTSEQQQEIDEYLAYVKSRSERERMAEVKEVTGAFTGAYAINPFTATRIPIYIGEYVLKDYGTGAIMAVPSDDERDHRFATKFGIEIIDVIDKSDYPNAGMEDKLGKMINSGFLTGMEVPDAIRAAIDAIEERNIGKGKVNFRLRDANYSRQRYWGEPFPIKYDKDGVSHAMSLDNLPLELPDLDDFKPSSGGKSPLARIDSWVNYNENFTLETDTMPGFAGSSWYFLRYMDAHNEEAFASQEAINYWQDVDLYIGGTEHAVGHLMYSRFWHKFLFDKGLVPTDEPFKKLINQGMIQGIIESLYFHKSDKKFISSDLIKDYDENELTKIPVLIDFVKDYGLESSYLNETGIQQFIEWRPDFKSATFVKNAEGKMVTVSEIGKMSKSKYNVVNPDDIVERYGADCFRMYEMFLGPLEQGKPWNTKGIEGTSKFLRKFWSLFWDKNGNFNLSEAEATKEELKILHTCIKKVTEDIERFSFNTCISAFMVCVNDLKAIKCNKRAVLEDFVVLLAPFAPHIAEELWHQLGYKASVVKAPYPDFNEDYLKEDSITYPIAINGKTRATADFPAETPKADLEKLATQNEDIQKWLEGKTIRKVIVVPKRMINIVVG